MALDFDVKDIMHNVAVRFVHAFLPEAKKPYNLKAALQPELDSHGIASKAAVYNIATSPKIIEEGMISGMKLMGYLAADGYKIKTPLFNLRIRIPGEYDGSETHLPSNVYPVARLQVSNNFRKYLKEHINTIFDGFDSTEGLIAEATDEATGLVDEVATMGNILTIHGFGLKLETAAGNPNKAAVFFKPPSGVPTEATVIAVNEPRTLKILVPPDLTEGKSYQLVVNTQSSAKNGAAILKKMRDMRSDFTVTAVKG
ncbi:MAG: DUF4469 domain-containing protein, partial [Treponema sp.]|jgi:hypothetical protein|nr:DUF4469 domain-containing protein [Treponema sp.]